MTILTHVSKKLSLSLCAFVLLISLSACAIVKIDGYEHEKTNRILNTFYWTREKAMLEDLIAEDLEDPVLVPDFQGFLSSRRSKARLRIITRENKPLVIERVIVWSPETDRPETQRIDAVSKPLERASGIWVATVDIALANTSEVFENAEEVRMSIAWRYSGSSEFRTTDFVLIRKQRRDVAWPT